MQGLPRERVRRLSDSRRSYSEAEASRLLWPDPAARRRAHRPVDKHAPIRPSADAGAEDVPAGAPREVEEIRSRTVDLEAGDGRSPRVPDDVHKLPEVAVQSSEMRGHR